MGKPEQLRDALARRLRLQMIPDEVWDHAERHGGYVSNAVKYRQEVPALKRLLVSLLALQRGGRRAKTRRIPVLESDYLKRVLPRALFAYEQDGMAVIQAHPRVPAPEVTRAYRMVQRFLLTRPVSMSAQRESALTAGRNRRVSEKSMARFLWIGARRRKYPDEKWRVTMGRWNRRFPAWAYKADALTNFIRDYRRAERYLALAPLEWDD